MSTQISKLTLFKQRLQFRIDFIIIIYESSYIPVILKVDYILNFSFRYSLRLEIFKNFNLVTKTVCLSYRAYSKVN